MPRRITVAQSTLNASTVQIINTIRANASAQYQSQVPVIEQASDIKDLGAIIYGTPALANEFINALINRIALVKVQGMTFNNPYERLKKGFLEYGETVEDIFTEIAKVEWYSAEKGAEREMKRTLPSVHSVFHVMNWKVIYPVTIEDEELKRAFLSEDGVTDLIGRIIDQVYGAHAYDEFLLFKYLLIKSISKGGMYPVGVGNTATNIKESAKQFRGISNVLTFPKREYNERHVLNNTPKERQVIFMDSTFNAQFDVEVLASAFNMDKAEFEGKLTLIDDFTTFDNERWATIREQCDGVEEVTAEELALMSNVKAVLCDEEWFQIYDNLMRFKDREIASGLYWNYFLHSWKTVSYSPFANAVVFVEGDAPADLTEVTLTVTSKDVSEKATTLTMVADTTTSVAPQSVTFVQTEDLVEAGIGVHPYGAYLVPADKVSTVIKPRVTINGVAYELETGKAVSAIEAGEELTLAKVVEG